jgi:hypothetical protein
VTDVPPVTEADADRMMKDLAANALTFTYEMLNAGAKRISDAPDTAVACATAHFAMLAILTSALPPEIQAVVQTIGTEIAQRVMGTSSSDAPPP